MSVLDLAFKQMEMMSMLQEQFNSQNKFFFGNNKNLGVLQSGRGGLPRGRGGLMRQGGGRLPGKVRKHKKFVEAEIADVKINEPKAIEEKGGEEEEEEVQIDNLLKGDVSSPFEKAAESDSEEEPEEVTTKPSKVVPRNHSIKRL